MPSIQIYSNFAKVALAAYAVNLSINSPNDANVAKYVQVDMAREQAITFDERWQVLGQAEIGDGFSAALFQNRFSGEKALGIRGTESSNWGIDFLYDVVAIAAIGSPRGTAQYTSLEAFYQQMVSTGKLGSSEQITVSGHSLGGFLAQAFAAKHDAVVAAAYTYNAPGFSGQVPVGGLGTELLKFFGITNAAMPNNKIFNARAVDGLSATAGLGSRFLTRWLCRQCWANYHPH